MENKDKRLIEVTCFYKEGDDWEFDEKQAWKGIAFLDEKLVVEGIVKELDVEEDVTEEIDTTKIEEIKVEEIKPKVTDNDTIWNLELPNDYIHMLNCMATFTGNSGEVGSRCSNNEGKSKSMTSLCRRLTADIYPDIMRNYYMKPSHKNPYWYIINNNNDNGFDYNKKNKVNNDSSELEYRYIYMKDNGDRTAHQFTVNIEIHSGNSDWVLDKIYITYIKAPMYVSMTEEEVLNIVDETQVLEFPDYICYEIINLFVKLIMENISDPRLQTNMPVNQTIAIPGSK